MVSALSRLGRKVVTRFAMLLAPLLLTGCYDPELYTFRSSEDDGEGIIIDKASGDWGYTARYWERVQQGDLFHTLVTVEADSYLYETQFGWVIPRSDASTSWGDERVACGFDRESSDGKLIRCRFANGRVSTFRWSKTQGVTAFSSPCVIRKGDCEFTLIGEEGPFSKSAPSLYLQTEGDAPSGQMPRPEGVR